MAGMRTNRRGWALLALAVGLAVCGVVVVGIWRGGDSADLGEAGQRHPPVRVLLREGWTSVELRPSALQAAADGQRAQTPVSQALAAYAESRVDDVRLAVLSTGAGGLILVQQIYDRERPIRDAVEEIRAQSVRLGVAATAEAVTFQGQPAWRLTPHVAGDAFRHVEYWVDREDGRYSVVILGSPQDVDELAAAVRFA